LIVLVTATTVEEMAKAKSKSTRKFEKNHLKDTIDRRKDFAKVKQRHQTKAKKQKQAAKLGTKDTAPNEDGDGSTHAGDDVKDMNDDQFFQEELQILGTSAAKAKKASKKDVPQQTGKRKRQAGEDENGASEDVDGLDSLSGSAFDSQDDLAEHKGQLSALAEKDPDFYKFLQENDADLLDFDDQGDLAGVDALSDGEGDEEPAKKKKRKSKEAEGDFGVDQASQVSASMVQKWKTAMVEQYSIRALRQLVLAFRAAAHVNDEDEKELKYSIPDPKVYHEVVVTALNSVPAVLNHHLPVKETAAGKLRIPTDMPKFKTLTPLIKSYTSSVHHLLSHLSDASTLKLTLQSFEPLLPYLLQFRKFLKVITKSVVSIWSDHSAAEVSRVTAFLILRRLMVIGDPGIREAVLKSTYEGIVKSSRNTTVHTLSGINLMKNSAAEIWGIDQKVSYTTGFTFIRQLAIHLRGNITKPTKDSYKTIYNWQFVHSLDFWSRVLSTHCNSLVEAQNGKESQLRALIYPVVQITLGVMRLIPTSTYFPLRFQLIRSLLRISNATGSYIPLASVLLEVLNSAELKKPPKPATLRPLDFSANIRAPSSHLKTRVYQDGVGEQVIELFSEFFVLWSKSIAFPELQLPVTVMLKRWLRTASSKSTGNKNAKLNQGLLLLVQKLEANARWIEERRNKVQFSPKDRAEVDGFLKDEAWQDTPLGAFVVGQRKLRDERRRVIEQGRKEEERKKGDARDDEDEEGDRDEDMADGGADIVMR
jgi:nucleolar complex protein 2